MRTEVRFVLAIPTISGTRALLADLRSTYINLNQRSGNLFLERS